MASVHSTLELKIDTDSLKEAQRTLKGAMLLAAIEAFIAQEVEKQLEERLGKKTEQPVSDLPCEEESTE